MIPSFYISGDKAQAWSVTRAAAYGAALGALAALFKSLNPLRHAMAISDPPSGSFLASLLEVAGAALGFALLCAGAAALRNFIARRLIWPEAQ